MSADSSRGQRVIENSDQEEQVPGQGERCQEAYVLLRSLLERSGQNEMVLSLQGMKKVDDVLKFRPQLVPLLCDAVWSLRKESVFQPFFTGSDGHVVEAKEMPIMPCQRSFSQIVLMYLHRGARLYLENEHHKWAKAQIRRDKARFQKREAADHKGSLVSGLISNLRELTREAPDFSIENYNRKCPGYGLYHALRPYLIGIWQFPLIPLYARLSLRQFQVIGEFILHFRSRDALEALIRLGEEDIALIRTYARLFAEIKVGITPWMKGVPAEKLGEFSSEEEKCFSLLMTQYFAATTTIRAMGTQVDVLLRRIVPVFGESVWELFLIPEHLNNVMNCPDIVFNVLKTHTRAAPPAVTMALSQFRDHLLLRDLLKLIVSSFPPDQLERYLSDPSRRGIWNALPGKFNNLYHYQPDAPTDSGTVKNHDNLRIIVQGIVDALRKGGFDKIGS